jgi:hypothetical protein
MATNASLGSDAHPSKDDRPTRGRDTREGAQDDGSQASHNSPPDHGVPTHSTARFLWECEPDTPVDELGERYRRWRDSPEQSDLSDWGAR